jgi:GDP-4-dehydro-6-deoxy-D-mannose reductase
LADESAIGSALDHEPDAVIHLAAEASGARARQNPTAAWDTNCLGTCRLAYLIVQRSKPPRLVFASTGEVYGAGLNRPALETDPVQPCSPYAASKAAAELALLELHRRHDADVVIARTFQQTGPGQSLDYVVPALARRLAEARSKGLHSIVAGNLEPTREFLDVRDTAQALRLLAERGARGGIYNVAQGRPVKIRDVFREMARLMDWPCDVVEDASLLRRGDIQYLAGTGERIAQLGWAPRFSLQDTLRDVISGDQ